MIAGKRVTVVGAGAIGLTTAYYLQSAGAEVVVLDRGRVGDAASRGNAGWITPMLSAPVPAPGVRRTAMRAIGKPSSPLFIPPRMDPQLMRWLWRFWRHCNADDYRAGVAALARLNRRTLPLFDDLVSEGVVFPMWSNGLLVVFRDPESVTREFDAYQKLAQFGYRPPAEILTTKQLHELEPALGPDVVAGFLLQDERHVDPVALTRGLAERICGRGGVIHQHFDVTAFGVTGDRVTAVKSDTDVVDTDYVVIAAGAWSGEVAKKLQISLPIQGGKGYSFSFHSETPPRHPLYLADSKVGVSSFQNGRVRVAGTMEFSGLDLKVKRRRIKSIADHARRFLAEAPGQRLDEQWVGMRPLTFDGLPVVGRAEQHPNVYVATGHSMLGMTLAPATGEALAEYLTTGELPSVLAGITPARFTKTSAKGVVRQPGLR